MASHGEPQPQGRVGTLLIHLLPKTRQQAIAPAGTMGCGGSEVGEAREASGLSEQGLHLAPGGAGEAQSPEHAELDHATPRRTRRGSEAHEQCGAAVTTGVTVASRGRDAGPLNWLRKEKLARLLGHGNHSHRRGAMRRIRGTVTVGAALLALVLACNPDKPVGPGSPAFDAFAESGG